MKQNKGWRWLISLTGTVTLTIHNVCRDSEMGKRAGSKCDKECPFGWLETFRTTFPILIFLKNCSLHLNIISKSNLLHTGLVPKSTSQMQEAWKSNSEKWVSRKCHYFWFLFYVYSLTHFASSSRSHDVKCFDRILSNQFIPIWNE